ncbi:MAG: hypothetical protein JW821_05775, partial [Deltaproteobacteria bacterium]|nr:hypothetical protein [Deltaproteobacteria bacterium]
MKLYPKILLMTMPMVLLSIVAAVVTTYYFSLQSHRTLAEHLLRYGLSDALKTAAEHEDMLRRYGLEELKSSVRQAMLDTGRALRSIRVGQRGCIFVVDEKGVVVTHPDDS